MKKKNRILITGGAGYIGSQLTPKLLKDGFKVTVLDNLLFNQTSLLACCSFKNFDFIKGDITDFKLVESLMDQNDIIIPLAALVGAPACNINKTSTKQINYDSYKFLISKIKKNHKLIFPNTNSGYGIGKKTEFCDEKSPLKPISSYGKYKVAIEKIILKKNIGVTLRLATVFGSSPRMRTDLLVNDFVLNALQNKSLILFESHFRRNFIHVLDVVSAFIFSIKNYNKMKGEAFNVGLSSANITKLQLAEKIKNILPETYIHESNIGKDPDKRDYIVSNNKIESLGWKPKYSLEYGIKELIKSYRMITTNSFTNLK